MEFVQKSPALSKDQILDWIRPVQDPELQMSLTDLGLVYGVQIEGTRVDVQMTLTSPGCPLAGHIVQEVKKRLLEHEEIKEAEVKLVWEPKWNPKEMASEEAKEKLGIW